MTTKRAISGTVAAVIARPGMIRRLAHVTLPLVVAVSASDAVARLPIRSYRVQDALADDGVSRIVRDSHGYLSFCTNYGLSRFDGEQFVNHGAAGGLPEGPIYDLVQTGEQEYLVAASGGLFVFDPMGTGPWFQPLPVAQSGCGRLVRLLRDGGGRIWASSDETLWRIERGAGGWDAMRTPWVSGRPGPRPAREPPQRSARQPGRKRGTQVF